MSFKLKDIGDLCSAPSVDTLIVIPDHTDVPMPAAQIAHQFQLQTVCILKLIDH